MKSIKKFDFYRKIPLDLTEPTIPGAIISIICGLIMTYLLLSEFYTFLELEENSQMFVKQEEGGQIRLNLNMTFPHVPCFVFSLDVVDIMGRHEVGVSQTILKTRIRDNMLIGVFDSPAIDEAQAFEMKEEGCNVAGYIDANKVPGSFHISSHGLQHLVTRFLDGRLNVNHVIHTFSPGDVALNPKDFPGSLRPLDGTFRDTDTTGLLTYEYFLDIIPTVYSSADLVDTKAYQMTAHTHQFPSHPGAMPAVYFRYHLSPISVKFSKRKKQFSHFLTYVCAIVGGVFTVAGLLNSMLLSTVLAFQKNVLGKIS
jgi:hypothetical protein